MTQTINTNEVAYKKPQWLRKKLTPHTQVEMENLLKDVGGLHTICQEAKCPNISECFSNKNATFLPLTLEMGSWTWVRKNPWQIFSKHGAFNPIKEHRIKRTYRRHHVLFDFLLKAMNSNKVWSDLDKRVRNKHEQLGLERWYGVI